ncbi:MAG: response regulator [Verrucomicrobiales bacterium]
MKVRNERRIVVVDDERIIAEDLSFMLEDLGYRVDGIAGNAQRACEVAGEKRPDLVCMDIVMQGQSDGIDAALRIRNEFGIPSVFLSAYSDEAVLDRAMLASPLGYLIKPYDIALLRCTLEVAFAKLDADRNLADMIKGQTSAGLAMHCQAIMCLARLATAALRGGELQADCKASLDAIADLSGGPVAFYMLSDSGEMVPHWFSGGPQGSDWNIVECSGRGQGDGSQQLEGALCAGTENLRIISNRKAAARGHLAIAGDVPASSELDATLLEVVSMFEVIASRASGVEHEVAMGLHA